jgi:hypothetical protein
MTVSHQRAQRIFDGQQPPDCGLASDLTLRHGYSLVYRGGYRAVSTNPLAIISHAVAA